MESQAFKSLEETQSAAQIPETPEKRTNSSEQQSGTESLEVPPGPASGEAKPSSEQRKAGEVVCGIIMHKPSPTGPCIWVGGDHQRADEAVSRFCNFDEKLSVIRVYEWEMELENALNGSISRFNQMETRGLQGTDAVIIDYINASNKSLHEQFCREGRYPTCDPLSLSNIARAIIQKSNSANHVFLKHVIGSSRRPGHSWVDSRYRAVISDLLVDTIMKTNVVAGTPAAILEMITHLKPNWKPPLIIMDDAEKIPESMSHALIDHLPEAPTLFFGDASQMTDTKDADQTLFNCLERAFREGRIDVDLAVGANGPDSSPLSETRSSPATDHEAAEASAAAKKAKAKADRDRRAANLKAAKLAAEKKREAAQEAAQDVSPPRAVPCLPCVRSALAGASNGECWDISPEDGVGGGGRCHRCLIGGACRPTPKDALQMVFFFLDYAKKPRAERDKKEYNKRRQAAKIVLAGCLDGTFPSSGDARLR